MATTITTPAPYSSVKEPLIFNIDRDADTLVEVTVNGFHKLLPPKTTAVNVAQYYRDDFSIRPVTAWPNPAMVPCPGFNCGRVANASITVDGVTSGRIPVVSADKPLVVNRFMSDLRRRTVMRGQIDELPVYASSPTVVKSGSTQVSLPAGIYIVWFRIPDDAPERFAAELQTPDGVVLDRVEYRIGKGCGVRLAWINAYGAIDYWNFESRRKSVLKISREKIYTEQGYTTTSLQADTTETVTSRPLSEELTAVLSRLFVAEGVWHIVDGKPQPVDITSESVTTAEAGKLSTVQVEFRSKIREL